MLDDLRAEFARYLADNASARFSMDKALVHVVGLAYAAGMKDGRQSKPEPVAYMCRGRLQFENPCAECTPLYDLREISCS